MTTRGQLEWRGNAETVAQQVGGDSCGAKHAVQCRIEQVVADHDQSRMLDRLRPMCRARVAQGTAARLAAHRARPAMHLALDDPPARLVVEIIGQRFEGAGNQRPIVEVAG